MSTQIRAITQLDMRRFRKWKGRFLRELKQPGVEAARTLLLARGCRADDLDSALFFAADCFNTADELPELLVAFEEARVSVLRDITRLKADLATMLNFKFASRPVWVSVAWFRELDVDLNLRLFGLSQTYLPKLQEQVNELMPVRGKVKTLRSGLVSGEIWLQAYVESATTQLFRPQVAVLLEAAANAYGGLKGSVFTEDAVSKRYSRFRKHRPRDYQELRYSLEQFRSRRTGGKAAELIPFLLERLSLSKIPILRKFVKATTSEERLRLWAELES